ncbi:MAG: hypothetical protein GXX91_08015 [Verrucomicrobiaceae bacterium]|nr:hypothetical protein [Verrucomicrobiaceae bacterium]
MKVPTISGIIRRRILLNYRVAPEIIQAILPPRFRPKQIAGHAIAGICLIRLERIRPKGVPGVIGISSENSAHRIAVEWEAEPGHWKEGVFISRRDTSSRLNALAGGRVFSGVHHLSQFSVIDRTGEISIRVLADDLEQALVDIQVHETDEFPKASLFKTLEESSKFFEAGCVGYSSRPDSCVLDGLRLEVPDWRVAPLQVDRVRSRYHDDRSIFPTGSIAFDHALLMRDIPHEWHSEPEMSTEQAI